MDMELKVSPDSTWTFVQSNPATGRDDLEVGAPWLVDVTGILSPLRPCSRDLLRVTESVLYAIA